MSARKSTKFPGVQARESADRRYRGRPDICYTIDYRDETGKRVRKDVGWASEGFTAALASEMRNRLIHEAKTRIAMHGVPLPSGRTLTLQEAWEKYRDDWLIPNGKDRNGPEGLIRTHLRDMLMKPLNLIDSYEIDKLMNKMRVAGLAPQTVKHAVGLLKRIFRRMRLWRLYSGPMPFEGLKIPRPDNARERFLSPQEANDLLNELKKHSVQTWAMSLVSLHCGLRFGEIARLVWDDIDFEGNSIFIARSRMAVPAEQS